MANTKIDYDMVGASQQFVTVKIGPGKSIQIPGYGNRYYCKELFDADTNNGVADIEIQTDATSRRPLNVGIGERVPEGSYFTTLTLFNPTSSTVSVQLYSGFGDILDNRLNIVRERPAYSQPVIDSATDVIASPALIADGNVIDNGDTLVLSGVPPAGYSQRRGFTVANMDPNGVIRIVDADGEPIGAVFPETTQVYYISGEIGVRNNSGANISVYVGEIWYRNYGA